MSIDARITKTKQKLSVAFSQLLTEHSFSEINVKDLVEKAQVNRSTFYLHYKSLDQFLDELESDLYTHLTELMMEFFDNTSWLGYINTPDHHQNLPILEFILHEIHSNILLQSFIKHRKYNSEFLLQLLEEGYHSASKSIQSNNPQIDLNHFQYYYSFISMGFIGLIFNWLDNDLKEPIEYISNLLHNMIYNNLNVLLKKEQD